MISSLFPRTVLIWRSLCHPPLLHPVFESQRPSRDHRVSKSLWLIVGAVMLLWLLLVSPFTALLTLFGLSMLILLAMTLLNGSLLGIYWAGNIAEQVADWQVDDRLGLLNLTPLGSLGSAWRIALATLHRNQTLDRVARIFRNVTRIVLVLLLLVLLSVLAGGHLLLLADVIVLVSVALVVWLDHIQSIITSVLIGLLIPPRAGNALAAKITAWLLFAALQMLIYLLLVGGYFAAESALAQSSLALHHLRFVLACILLAGTFLIREGVIRLLIALLLHTWQESSAEFAELLA